MAVPDQIETSLASAGQPLTALEVERLKLLRELAVALSHELNNPLTSLIGRLHLAEKALPDDAGETRQQLAEMRPELERVRAIVAKLARASRVARTEYVLGEEMIDLERLDE